jgi:hypothetical protein
MMVSMACSSELSREEGILPSTGQDDALMAMHSWVPLSPVPSGRDSICPSPSSLQLGDTKPPAAEPCLVLYLCNNVPATSWRVGQRIS